MKAIKIAGRIVAVIIVIAISIWAVGALYYSPILPEKWRPLAAGSYASATVLAFLFFRRRGRTALLAVVVFAVLLGLFFWIPGSNDRDWQPEVENLPYATINGDKITIHNVRNFADRSESDFDTRWETRTYDLSELDSVDVIAVYWAGKPIAHVMLSFGFAGKDYLAVSIETRKENGDSYSTLAGFFRQYELYYVVADERDVVRVRTTYRQPQEDVYVYRVKTPLVNIRRGFLDYVKTMNDLRERPSYYNTLTTNCTTSILFHTRMNPESPPLSWKVLLSGYVPDYLYELGRLDQVRPFAELERLSTVNTRAHAAGTLVTQFQGLLKLQAFSHLGMSQLPTSVDIMSPGNPFIRVLSESPIDPKITAHSIIAVLGEGPITGKTDGVVAYESAHIDGVASEVVVRSGHSTQGHPETIEEVQRILTEHIDAK